MQAPDLCHSASSSSLSPPTPPPPPLPSLPPSASAQITLWRSRNARIQDRVCVQFNSSSSLWIIRTTGSGVAIFQPLTLFFLHNCFPVVRQRSQSLSRRGGGDAVERSGGERERATEREVGGEMRGRKSVADGSAIVLDAVEKKRGEGRQRGGCVLAMVSEMRVMGKNN